MKTPDRKRIFSQQARILRLSFRRSVSFFTYSQVPCASAKMLTFPAQVLATTLFAHSFAVPSAPLPFVFIRADSWFSQKLTKVVPPFRTSIPTLLTTIREANVVSGATLLWRAWEANRSF